MKVEYQPDQDRLLVTLVDAQPQSVLEIDPLQVFRNTGEITHVAVAEISKIIHKETGYELIKLLQTQSDLLSALADEVSNLREQHEKRGSCNYPPGGTRRSPPRDIIPI